MKFLPFILATDLILYDYSTRSGIGCHLKGNLVRNCSALTTLDISVL